MNFDIYTNRVPNELLTDAEQFALMAHRGEFEWWDEDEARWRRWGGPLEWLPERIMRAVRPAHAAPSPAQFEVGKTYRTRGGGTAKVLQNGDTPVPLYVKHGCKGFSHFADGSSLSDPNRDLLPGAIDGEAPPAPADDRDLTIRAALAALTGLLACDEFDTIEEVFGYADAFVAEARKRGLA